MALPGVAALALGALYATGALLKMSDLRGDGLNVRDTLPLVPLEELLSRGIGTAITASVVVLALVMLGVTLQTYWTTPPESVWGEWNFAIAFFIAGAGVIAGAMALPWIVGAGVLVAILVAITLDGFLQTRTGWAASVLVIAGFGTNALVSPQPLPIAELRTEAGTSVSGSLVTLSNDNWYVERDEVVRAVATDKVQLAEISSSGRPKHSQTLFKIAPLPFGIIAGLIAATALLGGGIGIANARTYRKSERIKRTQKERSAANEPAGPGDDDQEPTGDS